MLSKLYGNRLGNFSILAVLVLACVFFSKGFSAIIVGI